MLTKEEIRAIANIVVNSIKGKAEAPKPTVKGPTIRQQELDKYRQLILDFLKGGKIGVRAAVLAEVVEYKHLGNSNDAMTAFNTNVLNPMAKTGELVKISMPHKRGTLIMIGDNVA